ncbi:MAG: hypothetical protein H0W45_08445 [Acidobacteria bacterium]|nr:hypothetical protein [Acidobacteriota bacterium]
MPELLEYRLGVRHIFAARNVAKDEIAASQSKSALANARASASGFIKGVSRIR